MKTICKKHLISVILLLSAFMQVNFCLSQNTEIVIENSLDFDRNDEIVEINIKEFTDFDAFSYILSDSRNIEIPYQLSNGSQILIFQASVPAKSSAVYTVKKGKPSTFAAKTHARYVPERKDDFAWENDFAAYRMYGPALAREYPSNGVDLWLKCTDSLIVDKFYADELQRGLSYHVNRGLGLDCYSVGHTMGAGGIAPYTSKLLTGNHYNSHKVIETGCLRSVFALIYDTVKIGNNYYRQTLTVSVDAGSIMNKAVVRYVGIENSIKLAAGIVFHKQKGISFTDVKNGITAYAENAVSDAGIPQGRNYAGVYMPVSATEIFEENGHLLNLAAYTTNSDFTYYFGGGWSKWKFDSDDDWFRAVSHFAQAKQNPLKIQIHKKQVNHSKKRP